MAQQKREVKTLNIPVRRRSLEPRIEFDNDSRPPRVSKMQHESYLNGKLYVGDVVLSVNDREIKTAEEFFAIVRGGSLREHQKFNIRVQRDESYQFLPDRVIERTEEKLVMDLQIRWPRGGMPLGVSMTEKERRVTIDEVEAGSIAAGHIFYGDIITHVDGTQIENPKAGPKENRDAARQAIFDAINNRSALTLRIERALQKDESKQVPIPDEIKKILGQAHRGEFYTKCHRRRPAIECQDDRHQTNSVFSSTTTQRTADDGGNGERNGRRMVVNIQRPDEVQVIPVDNKNEPRRTPPRPGSVEKREDNDNRGK